MEIPNLHQRASPAGLYLPHRSNNYAFNWGMLAAIAVSALIWWGVYALARLLMS